VGLKSFLESAGRLLRLTAKPDRETFSRSVKITALGIAILGGISFLIRIISATIQGSAY